MALKYGLARKLNIYNIDTQEGGEIVSSSGDYFQAQLWRQKHLKDLDDDMAEIVFPFVWAYFALARNNELEKYGYPEELSKESLLEIANNTTVYIDQIKDGSLPLANAETSPNR